MEAAAYNNYCHSNKPAVELGALQSIENRPED